MGMFNWVDFKCKCPTCKKEVSGFQSKDGVCLLETVKPWQVDRFYSHCRGCDTRIEYDRLEEAPVLHELLAEAIMLLDTAEVLSSMKVESFLGKTRKYISLDNAWLEDFQLTIETKKEAAERWKKN